MRKLFIVSAKILGLIKLYETTVSLLAILVFMPTLYSAGSSEFSQNFMLVWALAASGVSWFLVWVLLFKAEALAVIFRIPEDELPSYSLNGLLMVALKFLGVYLIVTSLPMFVREYAQLSQIISSDIMNANDQRLELIDPALLTGLGLALIIWTQKIAKLVLHEKPA